MPATVKTVGRMKAANLSPSRVSLESATDRTSGAWYWIKARKIPSANAARLLADFKANWINPKPIASSLTPLFHSPNSTVSGAIDQSNTGVAPAKSPLMRISIASGSMLCGATTNIAMLTRTLGTPAISQVRALDVFVASQVQIGIDIPNPNNSGKRTSPC